MSWNVEGLTQTKKTSNEFIKILTNYDIICLSETWTKKSSNIELNGYTNPIHSYRRFQHRRANRASGGIIIYIKDNIRKGVKLVRNTIDSIVWFKLDKLFFQTETDIYIAAVYIPPESSPYHDLYENDIFNMLENDLAHFCTLGNVFVCGDMNSRVGNKCDYIQNDIPLECEVDNCTLPPPPRKSSDFRSNRFGEYLLDLCKSTNSRLVNGRLYADRDIGKKTCITHNGQSTVDYLLTSAENFMHISDFEILEFTQFSNHAPLTFSLKINTNIRNKSCYYSERVIKWDANKKELFLQDLVNNIERLESALQYEIGQMSDSDKLVDLCSEFFSSVGNKYFSKTVRCSSIANRFNDTDRHQKYWFDEECRLKRQAFKIALKDLNRDPSDTARHNYLTKRKDYKYCCRNKKLHYNKALARNMNDMRRLKPREFWNMFKKTKPKIQNSDIPIEDFLEHFKKLSSDNDANKMLNLVNESEGNLPPKFEELDQPITLYEIKKASPQLGSNKSCSSDDIIYEYFKESINITGNALLLLFNYILETGKFPQSWCKGLIIPIYKKGDTCDPNNYRGITLTSCFAKFFTVILNNRLKNWAEQNDILTDAQFGFRKSFGTTDAVFILNALIEKQFNSKCKLYSCFIDFKKAFDSIDRNSLWYKLCKSGIDGKMLNVLKSMYQNVKMQVKHINSLSQLFESNIGLFQGETTSPIMFSLFLNDIEQSFQLNLDGLTLDQINIFLLMFADDAVLLSETKEGLQDLLKELENYCKRWNLTVNIEKTKVMIFRKGGRYSQDCSFTYAGETIEIVQNFNYLGVVFSSGGSFQKATDTFVGKALRSMCSLHNLTKGYEVPPYILFNLFDSYVASILSYNCEVWGFNQSENVERVHRKFCKQILNVKKSTNSKALLAEVGRFPLIINRHIRIVKYWLKLFQEKSGNCILATLLNHQFDVIRINPTVKYWTNRVKTLLENTGFNEIWLFPESIIPEKFFPLFATRLKDIYISNWRTGMSQSSSMQLYANLKTIYERSSFISVLENKYQRNIIAKIRLSSHELKIETGRHNKTERKNRICDLCSLNDIEDEFHFTLICPIYKDLRLKYIPRFYINKPSMYKFIELLKSSNKRILSNLSLFFRKAFLMRKNEYLSVT